MLRPVIQVLKRFRQEDCCEFKTSQSLIVSPSHPELHKRFYVEKGGKKEK